MAKTGPSEFVQYLHEQLSCIGDIESGRFFGGRDFRYSGIQFAMVVKDTLYFKVDENLRNDLIAEGSVPFSYNKKDGTVTVQKYYSAPEICVEDSEQLIFWAQRAITAVT